MPKLLSSPTTLSLRAPPTVSNRLADGPEAGSFDAATDVWKPGRKNGVVNASSWALVPARRWVSVAGTSIDTLTESVLASVPGWTASALAWEAVMNAWNGFAIDAAGSRLWLVAAGGHADGANNGIYRFDALRMSWAVEKLPSNRTLWSQPYKTANFGGSTYTLCAESSARFDQKTAAGTVGSVNDWYYDEVYWDNPEVNPGISPVGNPTARHVYSSTIHVPRTNELVMACRRLWRYSLDRGEWTYKRQFPKQVDGAELQTFHDEVRNEFLFAGEGDGIGASLTYDLARNTWNEANWAAWTQYTVADCRRGRDCVAFAVPFPDLASTHPGKYWQFNLDARTFSASGTFRYGGGLALSDFLKSTQGPDGCAIEWIPELERFWLVYSMVGGPRWLQLDPTTVPWTLSPLSFTNAAPKVNNKPKRKLVYLPELRALILFSFGDAPAYVYKF